MSPSLGSAHRSRSSHSDDWILLARILKQGLHKQEKVSSNAASDCACDFGFGSGRKNGRATGAAASFVFGSGSRIGPGWPRSGGAKAGVRRAEGSGADAGEGRKGATGGRRDWAEGCGADLQVGENGASDLRAPRRKATAGGRADLRAPGQQRKSAGEMDGSGFRSGSGTSGMAGSGLDLVRDGQIRSGSGAGWPDPGWIRRGAPGIPDPVRVWHGMAGSGLKGTGSGPARQTGQGSCRI